MVDCGMLARSPEVHAMSAVYPHRPLRTPVDLLDPVRHGLPQHRSAEKGAA